MTTITKQITPYVRSIAKVKERLEPRFQVPVDEDSQHLQNTYDGSVDGETQARNDPVSVTEKRDLRDTRKQPDSELPHRRASSEQQRPSQTQTENRRSFPVTGADVPVHMETVT